MAYARRRDKSHPGIAEGLEKLGFSVADTSRLGEDFPDLVIGKFGVTALVECKSPPEYGRRTAAELLSAGQKDFAARWQGSTVIVAYGVDDVVFQFNLLLKRNGWVK